MLKKYIYTVLFALMILGCRKDGSPNTSLDIIVYNEFIEPLQGARVELYETLADWKNRTNQVADFQTTDKNGKVSFRNLPKDKYFWYIETACGNNKKRGISTQFPLRTGLRNEVSVIHYEYSILQLVNKSPDRYNVFVDDRFKYRLAGNETLVDSFLQTGTYNFEIVQGSGIINEPKRENYRLTIACGRTTILSFPN